ncbi:MAG TPA: EthD family reductase [Candidatus Acidoferrales bacterium]|nr:EthD family reductase [Candidatus Acidoferrales bacterium]
MVQLIVLYKNPKDTAAFDKAYFDVHVPLAKKIPGVRKYEVSRGPISSPTGKSDVHLAALLEFDDTASLQKAFASPEGQAAAAHAQSLASLEMLFFEVREV